MTALEKFEETIKVMIVITFLIFITALSLYMVLAVAHGVIELFGKVMLILFNSN